MKYVTLPINGGAVFARAEAAECKTSPCPACLSFSLSVVSVAQPERQGRRSGTFTLPLCETSRGVLMNEVAISYCSVKRVVKCACMCQRGRERQVNARIGLPRRKDELEKDGKADSLSGKGAVDSAGVIYVKILEEVS